MKRDLNLIRYILFVLESENDFPIQASDLCKWLPEYNFQDIFEPLKMLESGGLITGKDIGWKCGNDFLVQEITYAGHNYIETIRNDTIFNNATSFIKVQGLPITLGILKDVCSKLLLQKL